MTTPDTSDERTGQPGSQRIDKWLWFVRVVSTRTQAAALVTDGHVRINRERCQRPAQPVRQGDVVTVAVGSHIRVLEVREPGVRRGDATTAQALFRDLTPPKVPRPPSEAPIGSRDEGSGRPTKKDRRALDRLRSDDN